MDASLNGRLHDSLATPPRTPPLLTLSQAVATHARLQPRKTALRDSRRTLDYAQ